MPSIVGMRRGNQTYYYLVESARVDGKPRIVSQQYLGSADEVMAKLTDRQAGAPVRTQVQGLRGPGGVWSVLERLRVADIIDAVVPRRADALASVGTYISLAVASRVVAPCSKLAFADWWERTTCPRWTQLPTEAVDHPALLGRHGPAFRPPCVRSRARSSGGWSTSTTWTCPAWCST